MHCQDAIRCANTIRRVLSEDLVNSIAREAGFFRRLRKLTPLRMAWTFLVGLGSGTADTIADLKRLFTDLTGESVHYKPFHLRLSNAAFPEFFRKLSEELMTELMGPMPKLSCREGRLSRFEDIWIQDGSSFALNERLASSFPRRFTKISPAAAEIHCTYSLFEGQAVSVAVAPDRQGERDFLPEPDELAGKLLLMDRGFVSHSYFDAVDSHGGHYICRAKDKKLNPTILECLGGFTKKSSLRGKKLKEISLPQRDIDLLVEGRSESGKKFVLRLVMFWVAKKKKHLYLYTNLPTSEFPPSVVATTYRLRWQVELYFKECKSYTKLKKFQTADRHIAEGLIWGTLMAVLIRRYLTYSAHEANGRRSAPLVAAAVSWMFFRELGRSAVRRYGRFRKAIAEVLLLLRHVAARTNPRRHTPFEDGAKAGP